MRIHAVNCASFHPPMGAPATHVSGRPYMNTRCLVIEHPAGIVLVDTGFGQADLADPVGRMGRPFLWLAKPRLDPAELMTARLQALGLDPGDVTDIVITHLDLDHAGGLEGFPQARVHIHKVELDSASGASGFTNRLRYVQAHWAHGPQWTPFEFQGERWNGFDVCGLPGLEGVASVHLPGHTTGHCGVLIEGADGWTLHAGDAFMEVREVVDAAHRPAFATKAHHAIFDADSARAAEHRSALRAMLADGAEALTVYNAHDPYMRTAAGEVVLQPGMDAQGA